ncbi:RidA family protein [Cytobacillus depressus]|uniref:RidA family protein n=1 Tax=Cytobacillus depressus TaxID=1602942 RepID=A0A6L3V7C0_9BACI|nr:RidA family protein [Cytobacillus depressus]KAB2332314.1 RidA family protein [Cytobacillus depressus]
MVIEEKMIELGLTWPKEIPQPMANYVSVRRSGNLLYLSGAGPFVEGKAIYVGRVGREISLEEAYEAARISAVNLLSVIRAEVGSLDRIKIVKLLGFVNSSEDFYNQPKVINGASDLLVELLGDNGKHARSAIGTSVLPFNIPVEIEIIAEILE